MNQEQPAEMQDSELTADTPQEASETREANGTDEDLSTDLLDEEQQTDDEIEDELEGVKVRGKKDLIEKIKNERLMQADYTRKTQELAEQRKAAESDRARIAEQAQMAAQYAEELAVAKSIDMRLSQYAQIDWAALEATDMQQAFRLQREMRELQSAKEQVSRQIAHKHQTQTLSQQQELARLAQEGEAVLSREIKGWGPNLKTKIAEFAVSQGFDQQALAKVYDPRVVKLLHDSMTLHNLRQKATQKPKPEAQPAPVTRINAPKAGANRDPEKMSADEWVKWRESQIKRK